MGNGNGSTKVKPYGEKEGQALLEYYAQNGEMTPAACKAAGLDKDSCDLVVATLPACPTDEMWGKFQLKFRTPFLVHLFGKGEQTCYKPLTLRVNWLAENMANTRLEKDQRVTFIKQLVEHGDKALGKVPQLFDVMINDPESDVRQAAFDALEALIPTDPKRFDYLPHLLSQLGKYPCVHAKKKEETLVTLPQKPDFLVRGIKTIAFSSGVTSLRETVLYLIDALPAYDSNLQEWIGTALVEIAEDSGNPEEVCALIQMNFPSTRVSWLYFLEPDVKSKQKRLLGILANIGKFAPVEALATLEKIYIEDRKKIHKQVLNNIGPIFAHLKENKDAKDVLIATARDKDRSKSDSERLSAIKSLDERYAMAEVKKKQNSPQLRAGALDILTPTFLGKRRLPKWIRTSLESIVSDSQEDSLVKSAACGAAERFGLKNKTFSSCQSTSASR